MASVSFTVDCGMFPMTPDPSAQAPEDSTTNYRRFARVAAQVISPRPKYLF